MHMLRSRDPWLRRGPPHPTGPTAPHHREYGGQTIPRNSPPYAEQSSALPCTASIENLPPLALGLPNGWAL